MEEMFLVDAGLGTPIIYMQDEPTGVPIHRATRFENKVGSLDVVDGESLIKEQILERFFINLVASESLINEQAVTRLNDLVAPLDVVAGKQLVAVPNIYELPFAEPFVPPGATPLRRINFHLRIDPFPILAI
ncbi:hypothetical protein Syun_001150 [Stephania yunnanensis]|uniref:Uncharacterized protein n=1 Tax=Stephania yunnanensis TaxID=152371 RepID=A0AAP0LE76_9MAGN